MTFLQELKQQRWDDHRYYHQNRINQSLHFFSSICFLISYVLLFIDITAAVMIGWVLAMVSRQSGHFFFEPLTYDHTNQATNEHKEAIKVGFNLQRKIWLLSVWAIAPVVLYFEATLFGLFVAHTDFMSFLDNLAIIWLVTAVSGLLLRTVHLFFIKGLQSGIAWFSKIITDPFHDFMVYYKAPYYWIKGEMLDDMTQWYDRDLVDQLHAQKIK
ncbi:MAG: DUF962 domain-containing protein [Gammaproteobacteria bacterium]|nr:DUF962 domain-containing protein [Gammaproteobacteria bacterium]